MHKSNPNIISYNKILINYFYYQSKNTSFKSQSTLTKIFTKLHTQTHT